MWTVLVAAALAQGPQGYGPNGRAVVPTVPSADPEPAPPTGDFRVGSGGPCGAWQAGRGPITVQVPFEGQSWPVDLYGKPGQSGRRRTVVLLHGAGGNRGKVVGQTGFDELVLRDGGLLVVPQALEVSQIGPLWDNGTLKAGEGRDDVRFLDAVADWVESNACAGDIMAVGFSNGAQMAARWACASDAPDVVMTHSGSIKSASCAPRNRWMLAYVGTKDAHKQTAGPERLGDMAHMWHSGTETQADEPSRVERDGKRTCSTWTGANPVTLCVLEGWGHKWPSPRSNPRMAFDATEHAWTFFLEKRP